MARVYFPIWFFPFRQMAKPFLLRNKQTKVFLLGNRDQAWKIPAPRWKFYLVTCNCKSISELRTEAPGEIQLWPLPGTPAIMKYWGVGAGAFPPSVLPAWQLPAQTCSRRYHLFCVFCCSSLRSVQSCLIFGESSIKLQRAFASEALVPRECSVILY